MTNRELLEYLRVFATIKIKFAEKATGQDSRIDAYGDVVAEIDRVELMLLQEGVKLCPKCGAALMDWHLKDSKEGTKEELKPTGIAEVDTINAERVKCGLQQSSPEEYGLH